MDWKDGLKVEEILPHGKGFIFVDGIVEIQEGREIVVFKDVREDEFWVPHHFPGNPVMPGVILVEAMAQSCALLAIISFPELKGVPFFLAEVKHARFKKPVIPPSKLIMKSKMEGRKANVWIFSSTAFVEKDEGDEEAENIDLSSGSKLPDSEKKKLIEVASAEIIAVSDREKTVSILRDSKR